MHQVAPEALEALTLRIVRAMGSMEEEAAIVARHLVDANLAGHDSHGVGMLPAYVRVLKQGCLVPNQRLELVIDAGGLMVFEAARGFGQRMVKLAMEAGIERARQQGACVVGVRRSCHVGRIGTYGEQCAAAGMASVHFVNVADHVAITAPFAGSDARLGTNPFCAAVPGRDGPTALLDMATSTIAYGKARVAYNKGQPVASGNLIDKDGRLTTDPAPMIERKEGALTAFGAHKGSGLAIMCELMGAALMGGQTITHEMSHAVTNNMMSVIVDTEALGGKERAIGEFEAVTGWVRQSPPAPGHDKVRMPGEPERESRERRRREGIPIDQTSLTEILDSGAAMGLDRGELAAMVGA